MVVTQVICRRPKKILSSNGLRKDGTDETWRTESAALRALALYNPIESWPSLKRIMLAGNSESLREFDLTDLNLVCGTFTQGASARLTPRAQDRVDGFTRAPHQARLDKVTIYKDYTSTWLSIYKDHTSTWSSHKAWHVRCPFSSITFRIAES
jgi:hypothetical protein